MPRYLVTMILIFWVPIAVLAVLLRGKIDPLTKKAFWLTLAIMTPLTIAMEYVYLWTDIWTFSEQMDPLLGIRIAGAPIEEFSFWLGASPFMLLVYLLLNRIFPRRKAEAVHSYRDPKRSVQENVHL